MKYKALALSCLLLLPLLCVVPLVKSDWPSVYATPILWVDAPSGHNGTKFWGPCRPTDSFDVDIRLWNILAFTGKTIYAYDFNVTWSDAYISLTKVVVHYLWPYPSQCYVIDSTPADVANDLENYHLAVTAMPPAVPLGDVLNQSLVTLTFHIDDEPCYPNTFTTDFIIHNNGMISDCVEPVPVKPECDNGTYLIDMHRPDIHLFSPAGVLNGKDDAYPGYLNITEKAIDVSFEVDVFLTNITHIYGFWIEVCWDSAYKKMDIQSLTIGPKFKLNNYAVEQVDRWDSGGVDYLRVLLYRPIEKDLVCGDSVLAFSFVLTTKTPQVIPAPHESLISIQEAYILALPVEAPDTTYEYDYVYSGPTTWYLTTAIVVKGTIYYSCDIYNEWKPLQGDITFDGKTTITDLAIVAAAYGSSDPDDYKYSDLWTPFKPTPVDLFDVVFVAKNFAEDP